MAHIFIWVSKESNLHLFLKTQKCSVSSVFSYRGLQLSDPSGLPKWLLTSAVSTTGNNCLETSRLMENYSDQDIFIEMLSFQNLAADFWSQHDANNDKSQVFSEPSRWVKEHGLVKISPACPGCYGRQQGV